MDKALCDGELDAFVLFYGRYAYVLLSQKKNETNIRISSFILGPELDFRASGLMCLTELNLYFP